MPATNHLVERFWLAVTGVGVVGLDSPPVVGSVGVGLGFL